MTIVARRLTLEHDGLPGYMAHPDGAGRRPGIQPHYADLVWPLVTNFLQRTV